MEWLKKLYVQVLIAVVLGVICGYLFPAFSVALKPLADVFIRSIKMLIAPLVFLTIVSGITNMHDLGRVGRLGGLSLTYFMLTTTLALVLGLLAAEIAKPGLGLNIDPATLPADAAASYAGAAHKATQISEFLLNIIPRTFFSALVEGELLQVLFVAIFFAIALILSGQAGPAWSEGMQSITQVFFKMIHMVLFLAPMATFAAMAYSVGQYGISPLLHLMGLVGCYYLTCAFFVLVILGSLLRWYCGVRMMLLLRYLKAELLIVWGTASSETVLPNLMQKLEALGCPKSTVGLIVPMGYSFNLAGTAIYLTMAALFIAQATNTPLTWVQELSLLGVMIISSKGAAGVSGSGFIVLASSLMTLGTIPPAGVILILGIDKFMNEGRAIINMIGNAVATLLISRWYGNLNTAQLKHILSEKQSVDKFVEAI